MNAIKKEERFENYIPVITRKEASKVCVDEILYIESERRVVNIYTCARDYRFYGKLDDITKYLNSSFYRCHKSCIINLNKIDRMEDGIFYFSEGKSLRVGQNSYQHTRSYFREFLKKNAGVCFKR